MEGHVPQLPFLIQVFFNPEFHRAFHVVSDLGCPLREPGATVKTRIRAGGCLAHPERLELPTNWFEASYSIQLSYGCA